VSDVTGGPYDLAVLRKMQEDAAGVMRDFGDTRNVFSPDYMLALWYNTMLDTLKLFAVSPEDSETVPMPSLSVSGGSAFELLSAGLFSLSMLADQAEEEGRYAPAARFQDQYKQALMLLREVAGHEVLPAEIHRRVSAFVSAAAFVLGVVEVV
jgi:hypothetical protein